MAVTFKEIDIVSSLFCRLSFSIRECQRGARFGIPCVFLFRVSDFIWFSHPYPRGKGESGTDRNSVFEAHGGRGWRALVWVHTGRRGPGEAVRFEVVLGYKWTQMADELPVFLGKISLARGTRKLAPLGTPCSPLLPGQPAPSQPFPGVAVAGATTVCAAPLEGFISQSWSSAHRTPPPSLCSRPWQPPLSFLSHPFDSTRDLPGVGSGSVCLP